MRTCRRPFTSRLLLLIALAGLPIPASVVEAQEQATGLIFATEAELEQIPVQPIARTRAVLPARVDLAPLFPAPASQGQQGSCTAWATSNLKAYQERVEAGSAGGAPERFSPAFIYNQINSGKNAGSNIADAFRLLASQGAAPLELMPYSPADYLSQPGPEARAAARRYRILSWNRVDPGDVVGLKTKLAAGVPIVIAAALDSAFHDLRGQTVWSGYAKKPHSGHAMVIIGYDESRQAFKILNSWGLHWGDAGYGWIHYDFVPQAIREAYVSVDAPNQVDAAPDEPVDAPAASGERDAAMGLYGDSLPGSIYAVVREALARAHPVTAVSAGPHARIVALGDRGVVAERGDTALVGTLFRISRSGERIRRLSVGPSGEWIALHGTRWSGRGLPGSAGAVLDSLVEAGETLTDADFLPDGTLLIVRGGNGWWSSGAIPPSLLTGLTTLREKKARIEHLAVSPTGAWVMVYNRNWIQWSSGLPEGLATAITKVAREGGSYQILEIAPEGGWIVLMARPGG